MTRESIITLILTTLRDFGREQGREDWLTADEDTRLWGAKSGIDSMTLVTLIAELEQRFRDEVGTDLVLADERAMSAQRSPFRRVGTLADWISELMVAGK